MPMPTVLSNWRRERHNKSSPSSPSTISQQQQQQSWQSYSPTQTHLKASSPHIAETAVLPAFATLDLSTPNENHPSTNELNDEHNNGDDNQEYLATSMANSWSSTLPKQSHSEREGQESLTAIPQSNFSHPLYSEAYHQDRGDSDSSKPNSPFNLTFPKSIMRSQARSDDQKSPTTPRDSLSARPENYRDRVSSDDIQSYYDKDKGKVTHSRSGREGLTDHSTHHHKTGKSVLSLLNPKLLLARRRSSYEILPKDIGGKEGYDPRIRGNIVHDFSAPRPSRNVSSSAVLQKRDVGDMTGGSFGTRDRPSEETVAESNWSQQQRTPVSNENIYDDQKAVQAGNSERFFGSESLSIPPYTDDEQNSKAAPTKNWPSTSPNTDANGQSEKEHGIDNPRPLPDGRQNEPPVVEEQERMVMENTSQQRSPQHSSPQHFAPRRFKSNASRFSFDMNGVGSSAEEKFLEEKHKKKQESARQAKMQLGEEDDASEFDDDGFDSDMLEDDDCLEEKIPGVNVDADDDDDGGDNFESFSGAGNALNRPFYAIGDSPDVSNFAEPDNSNGGETHSISEGDPVSKDDSVGSEVAVKTPVEGSPLTSKLDGSTHAASMETTPKRDRPQWNQENDDLYFADGDEFDDLTTEVNGGEFDESIFDDETSHLYDRNTPAAQLAASRLKAGNGNTEGNSEVGTISEQPRGLKHAPSMASEFRTSVTRNQGGQPSERMPSLGTANAQRGVLTEHNLEALHNALEKAASEGPNNLNTRFGRGLSVHDQATDRENVDETANATDVPDESPLAHGEKMANHEEVTYDNEDDGGDDDDDDAYDDLDDGALYDIIAEANAEALENDDEGFYGHEFGFYPQPYANAGNELISGGYFGPHGLDGLGRTRSGKAKMPGPALTPITERSEWSTRNSMASVNALTLGHPHLVDMSHNMEDEMSLSALMKLRREAWGGTDGSMNGDASTSRVGRHSPAAQYASALKRSSFPGPVLSYPYCRSMSVIDGDDNNKGRLLGKGKGVDETRSSWMRNVNDTGETGFEDDDETKSI